MSDELKLSIAAGREAINKELKRLQVYFDKIGYTVTQSSVAEESVGGVVKTIKGSLCAFSPDDHAHVYSTQIPISADGHAPMFDHVDMLSVIYPDIDTFLPR
jgi:hypothetical protein